MDGPNWRWVARRGGDIVRIDEEEDAYDGWFDAVERFVGELGADFGA